MNRIRLRSPLAMTGALIVAAAVVFAIVATVYLPRWWLSGLVVLDIELAAFGVVLILMQGMTSRRAQADVVEHMVPQCIDLLTAASDLENLRVWPEPGASKATSTDPSGQLREIVGRVHRASNYIAFLPDPARLRGNDLIAAAEELARVITDIRTTTESCYGDVDQRVAGRHTSAVAAVAAADEGFVTAIRSFVVPDRWSLARLRPRARRVSAP